jgi:hypothetical protein
MKFEAANPNIGVTDRESSALKLDSTVITSVLVWKHDNDLDNGFRVHIALVVVPINCGKVNCIQAPPPVRSVDMIEP